MPEFTFSLPQNATTVCRKLASAGVSRGSGVFFGGKRQCFFAMLLSEKDSRPFPSTQLFGPSSLSI